MKLGQIKWNNEVTAAVFDGETARPIPGHTLYDLVRRSEVEKTPLTELAATHKETAPPVIPLSPKPIINRGVGLRLHPLR